MHRKGQFAIGGSSINPVVWCKFRLGNRRSLGPTIAKTHENDMRHHLHHQCYARQHTEVCRVILNPRAQRGEVMSARTASDWTAREG